MNNPLGILAGILVCSTTLPVFLSTVSYNNIEINDSTKEVFLTKKPQSVSTSSILLTPCV